LQSCRGCVRSRLFFELLNLSAFELISRAKMKMTPWQEILPILILMRPDQKSIESYQDAMLLKLVKDVYASNMPLLGVKAASSP